MNLSENGELLRRDIETNKVLNISFWNIVQILNISRFPDPHPLIQSIKDSILRNIENVPA